jgi:adenine-specific DNA-methyltransferase
MAVNISYMGTKRSLAHAVAQVIERTQQGILFDAFSGMCSVGEEVAPARQIWTNDAQVFSAEVARALFASNDEPPGAIFTADRIHPLFAEHRQSLTRAFPRSLLAEQRLVGSASYAEFSRSHAILTRTLRAELAAARHRRGNLFTSCYSNNYFGLHQAIDIDSVHQSISLAADRQLITADQKRWLLIALGRAILKISNSTGHFAQYLKPSKTTFVRYLRQRRREVWEEWLYSTGELTPVGTISWRRKNRTYNEDSLTLIPKLRRAKDRPSVIYADPPYTDDQYSRFYHLLDTLVLYDYPTVSGAGLYRAGRFATPFSIKSTVVSSFDTLLKSIAKCGADLVLSYPTNGLLYEAGSTPSEMLRKHFRRVERCYAASHDHSTFGASKGAAKSAVTEVIYLARP